MRKFLTHILFPTITLALFLSGGAPRALAAQQQESQQCTATVIPQEVHAGQAAARVRFSLSEDVGAINDLKAPEGSGIRLSSPEDLPRQEMANPDVTPKPIEMSREEPNVAILWLNTTAAQDGTKELTLVGEHGTCTAQLNVASGEMR